MEPHENQLYTHYKGALYKVVAIAYEEASMTKVVVYKAQYETTDLGDKPTFTRPLTSWNETVEVDGKTVLRFAPVSFDELQFITGNAKKIQEARQLWPDLKQLKIDLPEIQSLDAKEIIEEKVNAAKELGHRNFFVEDVSLTIDSLGFPGPLVKWSNATFGLTLANYFENEPTTVTCSIGYCDKAGDLHFVKGEMKGKLVKPRGEMFGFNPMFEPNGYEQTLGEMSIELKAKVNHRAIALAELAKLL